MHHFVHEKSAVGTRLSKFRSSLEVSPPSLSKSKLLIFLCGASVGNLPSPRRQAVQKYIHSISDSHIVLYAEGIFSELVRHGHKKNILDLEHEISDIADRIVIILESESTFCELGAFSGQKLRQKLVVVNSLYHKSTQSFINQGPIIATEEAKGAVLWYPMINTPTKDLDGIGAIYPQLKSVLAHKVSKVERVTFEALSTLHMNKYSLYFVHDLVLLCGPISYEELIIILKHLFPMAKSFDPLKSLLGMLKECNLIRSNKVNEKWIVRAIKSDFFMKYSFDPAPLMAAFRTYHLKSNPERYNGP